MKVFLHWRKCLTHVKIILEIVITFFVITFKNYVEYPNICSIIFPLGISKRTISKEFVLLQNKERVGFVLTEIMFPQWIIIIKQHIVSILSWIGKFTENLLRVNNEKETDCLIYKEIIWMTNLHISIGRIKHEVLRAHSIYICDKLKCWHVCSATLIR